MDGAPAGPAADDDDWGTGPTGSPRAASSRDRSAAKKRGRDSGDELADAYDQGGADHAAGTVNAHRPEDPSLADAYDGGVADAAAAPKVSPASTHPAGGPPRPPSTGGAGGGFSTVTAKTSEIVLGALAYAVGINYIRGGFPQVKQWFAAKFTNSTGAASSTNPAISGGATAANPTGGSGGTNSPNGANTPIGQSPSGNGQPVTQTAAVTPAGVN